MYVILWVGFEPSNYLIALSIERGARWGKLRDAKFFDSEAEAERYITGSEGVRFWNRSMVMPAEIHNLNIKNR